jgi:hypothetical protein
MSPAVESNLTVALAPEGGNETTNQPSTSLAVAVIEISWTSLDDPGTTTDDTGW